MSGTKSLFKDLDESKKSDVRLGDNKKIQVEGEGTVSIMTSQEYGADQFLAGPSTTSSIAPATSPTLEEP
uniref:Retrovirus-related Pol polyprotein from transposon TNT 1-94-like beta-barrel domain-containing protein n=1 Tax=Solanum lycopersicum TaxID=4081 RepID=A0A3Q7JBG4_SOLLC